ALFFENNSKGKFISGKNIIDLNYFIDELAMYRPTGILSLSDNIDINFENFYKYSTIIFITNSLNKDDSKEILTLKMKGINPIIIYITDLENKAVDHDYSYLEILKLQSISIYELDYNSDFVKEMEAHYDERF
ncbi:hypothetical protein P3687_25790, partial [Vibrio parahaemolyticus]|nr:hypothetical protein [Vibrio parahaemolyticus]